VADRELGDAGAPILSRNLAMTRTASTGLEKLPYEGLGIRACIAVSSVG
jgi:hypothetical protein